jgi:hypothetical protein
MDGRLEKYFAYVTKNLINKTIIDVENGTVVFPFLGKPKSSLETNVYPNWGAHLLKANSPTLNFEDYVSVKYGVNEREYRDLWLYYKDKLMDEITRLRLEWEKS